MPVGNGHSGSIRFGAYEVDEAAHELRKNGLHIHLQDQPWEILCALLERPGEVVPREDLQKRLWPDGTHVDFEKSLNKVVNKLREALCDSAENPRYVQTLSRRGYRFVAPVEVVEELTPANGSDGAEPAPGSKRPGGAIRPGWWIAAAVCGVAVGIAAAIFVLPQERAVPSRIESIAVLPLQNLSRDPDQEYFADGLTDMLIGDLGKVGTLRVISHTSVMQYKGTKKPLPEIARELNVDAALEGTVLRSGNRVRITAQLLQARTDTHLWAETYERDFEDVIGLEKQMALAIAHEVTGRIVPAQETRLTQGRTTNPRAYDAYLRGRYYWNQRTAEPVAAAVGYFEQALREDQGFALAWSGLADCLSTGWGSKKDYVRAEEYARKALALDPELAEAHASLGIVNSNNCNFTDAEKELKRALDLNPNYVMAHHWYALHLLMVGRPTEALAENDRALRLDPFSMPANFLRGHILVALRQYDRAVEQYQATGAIDPQSWAAHGAIARIYWDEGRVSEALAEERQAAAMSHSPERLRSLDEVAAVYAKSGLRAAKVKLVQLQEAECKSVSFHSRVKSGEASFVSLAVAYAVIGDKEKTLYWLDQSVRDGDVDLSLALKSTPQFDFIRTEPRYHAILQRFGLPQ
jgi:TolB-like protein/DNA-binding winged helix-turn-helix (wHTH) protein/Tfp pilus assembly protein PilF